MAPGGINDPASCHPHSFTYAARQHLFGRLGMQRNPEAASRHLQPWKQHSHTRETRQVRGGGCHLKCPPLNHCFAGKHREAPVFADSNVRAASQEKAEIRTGERRSARVLG
jgi:hypothetical protein